MRSRIARLSTIACLLITLPGGTVGLAQLPHPARNGASQGVSEAADRALLTDKPLPDPATLDEKTDPITLYWAGLQFELAPGAEAMQNAIRCYRLGAAQGYAVAMQELGNALYYGQAGEKDIAQAAEWYRKAAELGNGAAMASLAYLQSQGKGVPRDLEQAFAWYKKAEAAGFSSAPFRAEWLKGDLEAAEQRALRAAGTAEVAARAEQGHKLAMFLLGVRYLAGNGVEKKPDEAARWFRRAAEAGLPDAMVNLGSLYSTGTGVAKDPAQALEWWRKAAEAGSSSGEYNVGWAYASAMGVPQDQVEACRWFLKAAEKGDPDALRQIAGAYQSGRGVRRDDANAIYYLRRLAETGDAKAQAAMGNHYIAGNPSESLRINRDVAYDWYLLAASTNRELSRSVEQLARTYGCPFANRLAAASGDADAMQALANDYRVGDGIPSDETQALKWSTRAAECGNSTAMLTLGLLLLEKAKTAGDAEAGMQWLQKAAERDPRASFVAGHCYEQGTGVAKDTARALALYKNGAEANEPRAMRRLGELFMAGHIATRDDIQALEWFRKAAQAGEATAMRRLAAALEIGRGTTRDPKAALEWYRKAAAAGDSEARREAARLAERSDDSLAPLLAAAQAGDPESLFRLGTAFLEAKIAPRDTVAARDWLSKSAEAKHVEATLLLADVLYTGSDVFLPDRPRAAELLRPLAKTGNSRALHGMGYYCAHAEGNEKDPSQARQFYLKAAEQGYGPAMNELGNLLFAGEGATKNEAAAVEWYRKAAEAGDPAGMTNYALALENGAGVARSLVAARDWYRKAADKGSLAAGMALPKFDEPSKKFDLNQELAARGDDRARFAVGMACFEGLGTKKNVELAFAIFQKLAALDADAQAYLGRCFDEGAGVPVDAARAGELFRLSAGRGSAEGMCRYALWLSRGRTNQNAAAALLGQAAVKGHAEAMRQLGLMYQSGSQGLPRDMGRAVENLSRAGNAGSAAAAVDLAQVFDEGRGVRVNPSAAMARYRMAVALGHPDAATRIESLAADAAGVAQWREAIAASDVARQALARATWAQPQTGNDQPRHLTAAEMARLAEMSQPQLADEGIRDATRLAEPRGGSPQPEGTATEAKHTAAEQEAAAAFYGLGMAYYYGRGVVHEPALAAFWLARAAEFDHVGALVSLGACCETGYGVKRDFDRAELYYARGALAGSALAMRGIARLFYDIDETRRDTERAMAWYVAAAARGDAVSMRFVGESRGYGVGGPSDGGEAAQWLALAAAQHDAVAMVSLGRFYETGFGVPKDLERAAALFRQASLAGSADAQSNLTRVEQLLKSPSK